MPILLIKLPISCERPTVVGGEWRERDVRPQTQQDQQSNERLHAAFIPFATTYQHALLLFGLVLFECFSFLVGKV